MRYATPIKNYLSALLISLTIFVGIALAQSNDQNFPTAITSNEVVGKISARDIGDSRTTKYFYSFSGDQGDIFINVVTRNLEGSIDVFTASDLLPLTKIVIRADAASSETGRLFYLRKPEKLLLRVEGRTPNDDPADFRIKFAGSFVAVNSQQNAPPPTLSDSDNMNAESGVRVNSVGTIIEVIPKAQPIKPVETAKKTEVKVEIDKKEPVAKKTKEVTVKPPVKTEKPKTITASKESPKKIVKEAKPKKKIEAVAKKVEKQSEPEKTIEKQPDPMANFRLVVELKDGTVFWRPMMEVLRFSVDKEVLTIIGKDGKITRYPVLNVAKISMQ